VRVVHNKEATMAAITETPIQDVQVGDRILSPADGRIWVSDAVFQDNHGTYTLVLTRDDKGLHLYDHLLLSRHATLDIVR
jgi:hypothetical protein